MRILISKVGLDGHDKGAKVLVQILRNNGFEVIYTGLHQTPKSTVRAAIQEDVDVLGLSYLAGSHAQLTKAVMDELKSQGSDIKVLVGGNIPSSDIKYLKSMGVEEVFPGGTSYDDIIGFLNNMSQRDYTLDL